jgi:hypothetical protein
MVNKYDGNLTIQTIENQFVLFATFLNQYNKMDNLA